MIERMCASHTLAREVLLCSRKTTTRADYVDVEMEKLMFGHRAQTGYNQ